jgi:hypothetical protein
MVEVMLSMACGCTAALVDDGDRLVACTANACLPGWWCECVNPEDPQVCDHAAVLLLALEEMGWRS